MATGRLTLAVVLVAATLVARAQQPAASVKTARDVPRITQADFRAKLDTQQVLVVDVRDDVAFKSGHIPGAIHVPANETAAHAAAIRRLAGTRLVVTYCSCAAEQSAAEAGLVFLQHGLPSVAALVGGYPDWIHAGGIAETGASH